MQSLDVAHALLQTKAAESEEQTDVSIICHGVTYYQLSGSDCLYRIGG